MRVIKWADEGGNVFLVRPYNDRKTYHIPDGKFDDPPGRDESCRMMCGMAGLRDGYEPLESALALALALAFPVCVSCFVRAVQVAPEYFP